MRLLFYIPIVHTPEDHGSHLEAVKREYIARYGLSKWEEHIKAVSEFWQQLSEALRALPVDYTKVRLYQDSMPVCGRELEIVEELADRGNRNYQLLLELAKRGAAVMGTEDPKLLIEERNQHRLIANKNGAVNSVYDDLMEQRDRFIAQRITATLKDGETGMLFIGALHRVVERLSKDIQVHRPLADLSKNQRRGT